MYKPGDLVRHRLKPEWGGGRVTGQTSEGKVLVTFTGRAGDVLLTAEAAEQYLQPHDGVVWTASSRTPVRMAPLVRKRPCNTCMKDVRAVVVSPDGAWRSCVACSARNGREHVFLPCSSAFDMVDPPLADGDTSDDPHYGWCHSCRAGTRASGYKPCNAIMR